MKALATAFALPVLFAASSALGLPVRILVSAGSGVGVGGEEPLRFAQDDARRVGEVFVAVGAVQKEDAIVLSDPTPETLAAAFARAQKLASTHRPDEVTFLFYFSGHGDHDAIHLGGRTVPLTDIATQIGAVPAALKIAIVDACRNLRDRPKGPSTEAPFAISLSGPPAATGAVWLHASADGEAAQESDELGGAIFTHYWVDGLRGAADANGDGKVTLSESYDFAYHQTLYRSSRGSGALQRPAVSLALKEAFPVVLTTTGTSSALKLPRSADAHYIVYALGSHTVAGEAWGSPDRNVVLALPAGRYVIQRRASGWSGALEASLARGEQRALEAGDFRAFEPEQLAQKGGEIVVHPTEIEVGLGVRTSALYSFGQAIDWRYAYRTGAWALSFGAEGGLGGKTSAAEDIHVSWLGGGVRIERRAPLGGMELRIGAGPTGAVLSERIDRTDAARVALAGYPTRQSSHAFALGADLAVGLRQPVTTRLALGLDVLGALLVATTGDAPKPYGSLGITAGAVWAF